MKINLVNFGCWKNKSFEFKPNGLNLLSGPSGQGKTTIIRAIVFALYGIGTKVISDGCTTCKVELWFNEFHIIRSKGPCRLLVNDLLEDDEAQAFINNRIGDSCTIYLEQNGRNTFVSMTPQQKLEFLEYITFSNSKLKVLKEKLANKIKDSETLRIVLDTRFGIVNDKLTNLKMPILPIDISNELVELANSTGINELIHSNETDRNSSYSLMEKNSTLIKIQQEYQKKCELFQINYSNKQVEYVELVEQVNILSKSRQNLEFDATVLEQYRTELSNAKLVQKLTNITNELKRQRETYNHLVDNKYRVLTEKLLDLEQKKNSIPYSCKKLARLISCYQTIEKLEKNIQDSKFDSEKLEKLLIQRNEIMARNKTFSNLIDSYQCPNCDSYLQMCDNRLVSIQTDTVSIPDLERLISLNIDRLNSIENDISFHQSEKNRLDMYNQQLEQAYSGISTISENINTLQVWYTERLTLDGLINDVQYSKSHLTEEFVAIESQITILEKEYQSISGRIDPMPSRSIEEIEQELHHQIHLSSKYDAITLAYKSKRKELKKCVMDIEQLTEEFDEQDFSNTISELEEEMETHRNTVRKCSDTISLLYRLNEYFNQKKEYDDLIEQQLDLDAQIKLEKANYSSFIEFKKYIGKAETIAIQATIDTLNANVQNYLDAFFVDEPLTARIITVKERGTKKAKEQLGIEILYKGMNMELKMLSGGEFDRIVLAFMLTIMEMNHTPIVLLDECISSLDSATADSVCEFIQEQSKNRCVILIAHQIISGMFDQVVDLTPRKND